MKKRIFGLFLFVLVLAGFFGFVLNSGVVSAAEGDGVFKEVWDALFGGIFDGVGGEGSFLKDNQNEISRYLLMAVLGLLVYSVASELPFIKGQPNMIRAAFSIVVALLGFLFIDSKEIGLILTNYQALGVILTSVVPLIIVLFFSIELRKSKPAVADIVNKAIGIGFGLYLLFTWVGAKEVDSSLKTVYLITFFAVIGLLVFEKKLWRYFQDAESDEKTRKYKEVLKKSAERDKANAETFDEVTGV